MHLLDRSEYDRWDDFVLGTGMGTIFHASWWYRSWNVPFEVYAEKDKQENILAGMLIHTRRFLGTRAIRRAPLTPANGPVFHLTETPKRATRQKQIRNGHALVLKSLPSAGFYDIILRPGFYDVLPYIWNGFETHLEYTYVIPSSEADTWLKQASKKVRYEIKQARKELADNNLSIMTDVPIDGVIGLFQESIEHGGLSQDDCFARMPAFWSRIRERGMGRIYTVLNQDKEPLCATMTVWDNKSAYYIAGGLQEKIRKQSFINSLLIERMIHDAHEKGLDFDFEGSSVRPIEQFFRGWGGEQRPFVRLIKIPSPVAYLLWSAYHFFKGHRRRDSDQAK
jgi:Acetyltransferase (GNAT) domain